MTVQATPQAFDGPVGGSIYGGRRTHIIQILRDSKEPLSVVQVADMVGIHANTARFHLESLVDAGLATRQSEVSSQPGRRRILYAGNLPNQTPERVQGYRLLAQILTGTIAARSQDGGAAMYEVGYQWGAYATTRPAPFEVLNEEQIDHRVMDKLDTLWFSAEFKQEPCPCLELHNCPFMDLARSAPGIICRMHVGMINGSLAELRSKQRVVEFHPLMGPALCRGILGPADQLGDKPVTLVLADDEPEPADHAEAIAAA